MRKAASGKDTEVLRRLLDIGGDVESLSRAGRSALMLAAWRGAVGNVTLLLERGADVDYFTKKAGNYGKTAIFYAITRCRDEVVRVLLEAGARVNLVNNKGQTPRSLAISHLDPATIGMVKASETEQLERAERDGARLWENFRYSHSDGIAYGDLDARFLDADNAVGRPGRYPPIDLRHPVVLQEVCVNATDHTNRGREDRGKAHDNNKERWWPRQLGQHSFVEKASVSGLLPWVVRFHEEEEKRVLAGEAPAVPTKQPVELPPIADALQAQLIASKGVLEDANLLVLSENKASALKQALQPIVDATLFEIILRVRRSKLSNMQTRDLYDNMQKDLDAGVAIVCDSLGSMGLFLFSVSVSEQPLLLHTIQKVMESQNDSMSKSVSMSTKYVRRIVKTTRKIVQSAVQTILSVDFLRVYPWNLHPAFPRAVDQMADWAGVFFQMQGVNSTLPLWYLEICPDAVAERTLSAMQAKQNGAVEPPPCTTTTPPRPEKVAQPSEALNAAVAASMAIHWDSIMPFYQSQCDDESLSFVQHRLPHSCTHWVDSPASASQLKGRMEAAMLKSSLVLGVDTEWGDGGAGCALVQIGTVEEAWLMDTMDCCSEVKEVLRWVLTSEKILKIGFSFDHDWPQLNKICPGIQSQSKLVFDLQPVASAFVASEKGHIRARGQSVGLKTVVETCFPGLSLDKTEQCSNWCQRPLSTSQLDYAALDAVVLVDLAHALRHRGCRF